MPRKSVTKSNDLHKNNRVKNPNWMVANQSLSIYKICTWDPASGQDGT